jgi:hypothetical protein
VIQHAALSPERWRAFGTERQLLMIANEMNRARSSFAPEHERSRRLGYERVLALTDLTIQCADGRRSLRRELLRWRDLAAELFLGEPDPRAHDAAFRALLSLSPAGWAQIRALGIDVPSAPPIE